MKSKKLFVLLALCAIWGSAWLASSIVAEQVPLVRFAAIRLLLGAILLLPVIFARKLSFPRGRALAANLILSVTMIALPFALIFWAQARVSLGIIAVLFAFTPLIAGFFGNSIRRAPMPHSAMYALILGVAGVVLLFSSAIFISLDQAAGIAVAFLAAASAAMSSVYAKRELARVHPVTSAFTQLSGAGLLLVMLGAIVEHGQPWTWTSASLITLILLGILASAVAYPLYLWLLKEVEPWQIGTIQWLQPLVAIVEGALLFRQPFSWQMVTGASILLLSLARVFTAQTKDDDAVTLQITR